MTNQAFQLLALAELVDTGAVLEGAFLALVISDTSESRTLALGDLTLATFTGSNPKEITSWGGPYIDQEGRVRVDGIQGTWVAGGTPSETVYGYAILNAGETALLSYTRLPQPVPITAPSQGLSITPSVAWGD